jgi:hypothetical protein
VTLPVSLAFRFGRRPASYPNMTLLHPSPVDPFDATMSAAVVLRSGVGGQPIPNLDGTAYEALCRYYGACSDALSNYAPTVLARAQEWESEGALSLVFVGNYTNPFSQIQNLTPYRVDMGVDYGGSGPILSMGAGQVYSTNNSGWPGGAFIGIHLTDGPYAGKNVYYAENVTPLVSIGDTVRAGQPIGIMHDAFPYTESGWAAPDIQSAGNTLAASLGQQAPGDAGSWTSAAGASFNRLLVALGAPSGVLQGPAHGVMTGGYP